MFDNMNSTKYRQLQLVAAGVAVVSTAVLVKRSLRVHDVKVVDAAVKNWMLTNAQAGFETLVVPAHAIPIINNALETVGSTGSLKFVA